MVEKDSEWILPENLKKQEKKSRELIDEGKGDSDHGADFGSYYAYRKGINFEYIKWHAYTNEKRSLDYVKNLSSFLNSMNLKLDGEIIDIGCAIGTITNAINIINGGGTYGLDLSEDGIEVARSKYPKCIFYNQSADDLSNFKNETFDIIHCREFYPFTKTNDKQYQIKYLKLFYEKLKRHGFIVLEMIDLDKGFCNTYKDIDKELKNIGYKFVKKSMEVPATQYNKLFGALLYKRPLYDFLQLVARILLKQRVKFFYILAK